MPIDHTLDALLDQLVDRLIAELTAPPSAIREGTVMTIGPVPYRRLDCDGRALAYIRKRPRKRVVRIDVSGLWQALPSPLRVPNASGSATLLVTNEADRAAAVAFLRRVVAETRAGSGRFPPVQLLVPSQTDEPQNPPALEGAPPKRAA